MASVELVKWSAQITPSIDVKLKHKELRMARVFPAGQMVTAFLPQDTQPDDIESNTLVYFLPYLYDDGVFWQIPCGLLELKTPLKLDRPKVIVDTNIQRSQIPDSIKSNPAVFRGLRLLRSVLWLLNENRSILEAVGCKKLILDHLNEHIMTLAATIWKATQTHIKIELERETFNLDNIPCKIRAVGTLDVRGSATSVVLPEMAVVLECLDGTSTKHINIDFSINIYTRLRQSRELQFRRRDLVHPETTVSTYIICGFPFGTDPSTLRIAAEAFAILLGTHHQRRNIPPLLVAVKAKREYGHFRMCVMQDLRRLLSDQTGIATSIQDLSYGLNHDTHLLDARIEAWSGMASVDFWFMIETKNVSVRRYFKGASTLIRESKHSQGRIRPFNDWTDAIPPKALLTKGKMTNDVWLAVEVSLNRQPHTMNFARCPNIGPISDLGEANSVSLQCISKMAKGWTASPTQTSHAATLRRIEYDQIHLPASYVHSMKLVNTLEHRHYNAPQEIGRDIEPAHLTRILQLIYSEPENTLTLKIMDTRSLDPLPTPTPSIVSAETNRQTLLSNYPNLVLDSAPQGLTTESAGKQRILQRNVCDMCHLRLFNWHFPKPGGRVHTQGSPLGCKPTDGLCRSFGWLCVPPSFTSEATMGQTGIHRLIGFQPFVEVDFPTDDPLPFREELNILMQEYPDVEEEETMEEAPAMEDNIDGDAMVE